MSINLVSGLAYFALLYVFVFGLFTSAVHMILAGIRVFRHRPAQLNWLVAGRWLAVLAGLAWLASLVLIALAANAIGLDTALTEKIIKGLVLVGVAPAIIVPVVLPLAEVARQHRTSSLTLAVASVVAFPVIVAFTTTLTYGYVVGDAQLMPRLQDGVHVIEDDKPVNGYLDADLYRVRALEPATPGAARLFDVPPVTPELVTMSPQTFEANRAALWLEMSLDNITFEGLPALFGLDISGLDLNKESGGFFVTFFAWIFHIVYPSLFWSVALLLVRSLFLFARARILAAG